MDFATMLAVASVVVFVVSALAMPAGLGGGLLYVPIFLMMGVTKTSNLAAALSQPVTLGAAVAGNLFNVAWELRNPGKRLIEPTLAAAAIAPMLSGVLIGAVINAILPSAFVLILLVLVMVVSFQSTMKKGIVTYRKENKALRAAAEAREGGEAPALAPRKMLCPEMVKRTRTRPSGAETRPEWTPEARPTTGPETRPRPAERSQRGETCQAGAGAALWDDQAPATPGRKVVDAAVPVAAALDAEAPPPGCGGPDPTYQAIEVAGDRVDKPGSVEAAGKLVAPEAQAPSAQSDRRAWAKNVLLTLLLLAALLLRGSKGNGPSLFKVCSWPFWTITFGTAGLLVVIGVCLRHPKISMFASFFVGVLCAIVGIGGGIVLNPMLLSVGLDAKSATATTSVLIVVNSLAATCTFLLQGDMPVIEMAVLTAVSFVGSLAGKLAVGWAVDRSGRVSAIIFLLASFMFASAVIAIIKGSMQAVEAFDAGKNPFTTFNEYCPRK